MRVEKRHNKRNTYFIKYNYLIYLFIYTITLATPDATTPTPTSDTNLTEIRAFGFAHFKS